MKVIAYTRVSTDEQGRSGLGMEAQRAALEMWLDTQTDAEVEWVRDVGSGKNLDRPGLTGALAALASGDADVLVAAKLDRVSRSVLDFARLLEASSTEGWRLVTLDLGVDTSTPQGRFMANTFANVAQLERELIGQRTRDALAEARKRGVVPGPKPTMPEDVRARIWAARQHGDTLRTIADALNREGVPTAAGGKRWYPSTVAKVCRSVDLHRELAEAREEEPSAA